MRIVVVCNGCKQTLSIRDKTINHASDELVLHIDACRNMDCYICGDCDEMEARREMEEKLRMMKETLQSMKEELEEKIQEIFEKKIQEISDETNN